MVYRPKEASCEAGSVYSLATNSRGNMVAAGVTDGGITIIDARTGAPAFDLHGHTDNVRLPFCAVTSLRVYPAIIKLQDRCGLQVEIQWCIFSVC